MTEDMIALSGFFITAIVLGLGIPLLRIYSRQKDRESVRPAVDQERDRRLERIEHAIEAMAIEVERISEGQRFVTRLLSERAKNAGELPAAKQ